MFPRVHDDLKHSVVCFFVDAMLALQGQYPDGDQALQENPVVAMHIIDQGYWYIQDLETGTGLMWLDNRYYAGNLNPNRMYALYLAAKEYLNGV